MPRRRGKRHERAGSASQYECRAARQALQFGAVSGRPALGGLLNLCSREGEMEAPFDRSLERFRVRRPVAQEVLRVRS